MYIISVHDETDLELTSRIAYRESEVEFTQNEFKIFYPGFKIKVKKYIPRTKEVAEQEIEEKLKKLNK